MVVVVINEINNATGNIQCTIKYMWMKLELGFEV